MAVALNAIDEAIDRHLEGWIQELRALCAIPSVSARHEVIEPCAQLVAETLRRRGFDAKPSATEGHPVVIGHAQGATDARTMLFYNHYDVQPPEPFELWTSPPFEATLRNDMLFARGVKDDKGEFVARLAALDVLKELHGDYPCTLTWLVDGEEEIGSPHLRKWVDAHRAELRCDAAIWEEGNVDDAGNPSFALGVRGVASLELRCRSISRDAHSGGYGNLLPNAIWRLVWALASIKGQDEKVQIAGYYDDVKPISPRQEELITQLRSEDEAIRQTFGVKELLLGRSGHDIYRAVFEPTFNIQGMGGGYQAEGSKTIVPAYGFAKIDMRLVPDQDPDDVVRKLKKHLEESGFADVEVHVGSSVPPAITDPGNWVFKLLVETAKEAYPGKTPRVEPLTGGTTPMYLFTREGVPVMDPGLGYEGTLAHSPNENIRLSDFRNAVRHLVLFLERFATAA